MTDLADTAERAERIRGLAPDHLRALADRLVLEARTVDDAREVLAAERWRELAGHHGIIDNTIDNTETN